MTPQWKSTFRGGSFENVANTFDEKYLQHPINKRLYHQRYNVS